MARDLVGLEQQDCGPTRAYTAEVAFLDVLLRVSTAFLKVFAVFWVHYTKT